MICRRSLETEPSSARLCHDGLDPERYLVDIIDKLERGWPLRGLSELLPQTWAAKYPAQHRPQ